MVSIGETTVLPGRADGSGPVGRPAGGIRASTAAAGTYLTLIATVGALLTAFDLAHETVTSVTVSRVALLAGVSLAYALAAGSIERMRAYLAGQDPITVQGSVWAFAAALTLPPGWASVVVIVLWGQAAVHRARRRLGGIYPILLRGTAYVLGVQAASGVLRFSRDSVFDGGLRNTAVLLGAAAMFAFVSAVTAAAGSRRASGVRRERASGDGVWPVKAYGYECASLVLAVVTGDFVVNSPVLTPAVIGLAAVLHRAALVNDLHHAAATDAKTGLLNATAWTDRARATLRRAAVDGRPVAVLVLDLDHFKSVNDLYGHLVGDEVLARVAHCLREELRDEDGIGRFGGEEFVVVLDGLNAAAARAVADRVRDAVAALRWDVDRGLQVTTSIGLAHTDRPATVTLERMLTRADEALYGAKSAGRDQVRAAAGSR